MKKKLEILESITGLSGIAIIGFRYSWWIALAIFLFMFSWNLHEYKEKKG